MRALSGARYRELCTSPITTAEPALEGSLVVRDIRII